MLPIPWLVALALQADGWYLRSAAPWVKRSAMPESVTDRPSSALEYVFLLARSERYFFDMEAVRIPHRTADDPRNRPDYRPKRGCFIGGGINDGRTRSQGASTWPEGGRSRRNSDWWFESVGMLLAGGGEILGFDVDPRPYPGAHFATFPETLITPMVNAGSSEHGACPRCSSPFLRVVERKAVVIKRSTRGQELGKFGKTAASGTMPEPAECKTTGRRPSCTCGLAETVPAVILDPFTGSGTAALVALDLGRRSIGIDLNADYLRNNAIPRIEGRLLGKSSTAGLVVREVKEVARGERLF